MLKLRTIKISEVENIIVGATFMGAGGGGSPEQGRMLIQKLIEEDIKEITLISPEEMEQKSYAVMVAAIGAPRKFKEKGFGLEAVQAFEMIKKMSFVGGRSIDYIMAGELGGFNSIVPIYVGALTGVPIVDADGNGRAVPELATGLYSIYDIPPYPLVLTNSQKDSVVAYLNDPFDYKAAETIARQLATGWDMVASFATWIVGRDQIMSSLAVKTITKSQKIGEIFKEVRENHLNLDDLSLKLKENSNAKELFRGEITQIDFKTEGGFDSGITTIEGREEYKGNVMTINFKNENILAEINNKVVAMVPDLISVIDMDNMTPITNADTKRKQNVAIYAIPAPTNWKKNSKGFTCWKELLDKMGYTGEYISYQKV
jgi:DUF917 family protein